MNLDPNLIAPLSGLGGAIIGGVMSFLATHYTNNVQIRLKRDETLRVAAIQRIEYLYGELYKFIQPSPPYDEPPVEGEQWGILCKFFEKNERYSSPQLLHIFYKIKYFYHHDNDINTELANKFYNQVISEYNALKETIGCGKILKDESKIVRVFQWFFKKCIKHPIEMIRRYLSFQKHKKIIKIMKKNKK